MSHYYSEKQDSPMELSKFTVRVMSHEFQLYTSKGIFSRSEIDKGTRLLIEKSIVQTGWRVLDLGCGLGIVGVSLKLIYPEISVVMSDINERAVALAKKNIVLHNIEDARAVKSDIYKGISGTFDTILINPPQTAGKKTCFDMIEGAPSHLSKGGLLQLVARHNKGGSSLRDKMEEVFGNAAETAKGSGYRIYVSSLT